MIEEKKTSRLEQIRKERKQVFLDMLDLYRQKLALLQEEETELEVQLASLKKEQVEQSLQEARDHSEYPQCFLVKNDSNEDANKKIVSRKFEVLRTITKEECRWLDNEVAEGTIVYLCLKPTYGCISPSGTACTLDPSGGYPFLELPTSALKEIQ